MVGQTITELSFQQANGFQAALSIPVAVFIGLFGAIVTNTDWLHQLLRWLHITRENSYPSEWFSAFASHGDSCYVVLHLKGERRLYGYAHEWPSDPNTGHFRVAEAEWLDNQDVTKEEQNPFSGVVSVLIPATEVIMVEFIPMSNEQAQETD